MSPVSCWVAVCEGAGRAARAGAGGVGVVVITRNRNRGAARGDAEDAGKAKTARRDVLGHDMTRIDAGSREAAVEGWEGGEGWGTEKGGKDSWV